MSRVRDWLRGVPTLDRLVRRLRLARLAGAHGQPAVPFEGSADYWRRRYAEGGDSGAGSYGKFARFKAQMLNDLFAELEIRSVVEFGSGDGNQLALLAVPPQYLGIDVSAEAVALCRARFAGRPERRFATLSEYDGEPADCALSLDVIYHLVEDEAFEAYMRRLFAAARRCVVVYSSNHAEDERRDGAHVRHRRFTDWIAAHEPGWSLWRQVPNAFPYRGDWRTGSFAEFYVFRPSADVVPAAPAQ